MLFTRQHCSVYLQCRALIPLILLQRVIQLTALEDWSVADKMQWEAAIKFMEKTLQDKLDEGKLGNNT